MKSMLLLLLTCLLLNAPTPLVAQEPVQPARLELPLDPYASEVSIQPIPADSSVVLLIEKLAPGQSRAVFSFQKYDQQLRPVWSAPLDVPREFNFTRLTAEGTMVYALFRTSYLNKEIWVAELDSRSGIVRTHLFKADILNEVYEFKALRGKLFVMAMVENHLTALLLDPGTDQASFLPSVYEQLPTNATFTADSVTQRAEFITSQTNGYKSRLLVKQLSAEGQLLHSEYVQAESERNLLTAQISPGSADRLLTGTYSLRDQRYSQGLFAADLNAGTTVTGSRRSLRFYDFLNLKHFFDFMPPARAARLKMKGERRRSANQALRLHYRLLTHDLLPTSDGYVLLAEIYYPRYRSSTQFSRASSYFDGYYTTHAIVCGFDRTGTLLWDNCFTLKNTQSFDLIETVQLRPLPDGQRFVLAYLDEYRIRYKIIDGANASPNNLMVPVQTTLSSDKEKANNATQQGMMAWYGSRFLAYGYQHIRAERSGTRDVFFLNAVAFDTVATQ